MIDSCRCNYKVAPTCEFGDNPYRYLLEGTIEIYDDRLLFYRKENERRGRANTRYSDPQQTHTPDSIVLMQDIIGYKKGGAFQYHLILTNDRRVTISLLGFKTQNIEDILNRFCDYAISQPSFIGEPSGPEDYGITTPTPAVHPSTPEPVADRDVSGQKLVWLNNLHNAPIPQVALLIDTYSNCDFTAAQHKAMQVLDGPSPLAAYEADTFIARMTALGCDVSYERRDPAPESPIMVAPPPSIKNTADIHPQPTLSPYDFGSAYVDPAPPINSVTIDPVSVESAQPLDSVQVHPMSVDPLITDFSTPRESIPPTFPVQESPMHIPPMPAPSMTDSASQTSSLPDPEIEYVRCTLCGRDTENASFCMHCGNPLERYCPTCGTKLPWKAIFCYSCGNRL